MIDFFSSASDLGEFMLIGINVNGCLETAFINPSKECYDRDLRRLAIGSCVERRQPVCTCQETTALSFPFVQECRLGRVIRCRLLEWHQFLDNNM